MNKKLLFGSVLAILVAAPIQKSEAVTFKKIGPVPIVFFSCLCETIEVTQPDGTKIKRTRYRLDPEGVESFQVDFKFDPTEQEFVSLDYIAPYFESNPPDLSQLSTGKILNISGETNSIPEGNVDLVELTFNTLVKNPLSVSSMVVSDDSYITLLDTDTGVRTTFDSSNGLSDAECVPEPLTILGSVAIGTAGILHKRFKRVSSSS